MQIPALRVWATNAHQRRRLERRETHMAIEAQDVPRRHCPPPSPVENPAHPEIVKKTVEIGKEFRHYGDSLEDYRLPTGLRVWKYALRGRNGVRGRIIH
jgi:hypothetical protein